MAATKRKTRRSSAKKAVKKSSAKMPKRSTSMKARKKGGASKKASSLRVVRATSVSLPPVTSVNKPFTKGQLYTTLAGRTGLQRRDISSLFDELRSIIAVHVKRQGPGNFTLPGLVKLIVINKPATKARKGINPFTGEEMMFKAKPARNVVKARALKQLKEMV